MWSGGKDSTVLLHLIKDMHRNNFPFPIFFIDSGIEFKETYQFIKTVVNKWKLKIHTCRLSIKHRKMFINVKDGNRKFLRSLLTKHILQLTKELIYEHKLHCLIYGGRLDDESPYRNKFFLKKDKTILAYPLRTFTEKDIWDYINKYNLPYVSLYKDGYRHIETIPFTAKPSSPVVPEARLF
ncbi:MAG: hypothetical protein ACD_79C00006G0001 [uncultured bacterium]|nr:MAG: hypothetical protein ACD_79C00006G0001 [uncultured bacterium]